MGEASRDFELLQYCARSSPFSSSTIAIYE